MSRGSGRDQGSGFTGAGYLAEHFRAGLIGDHNDKRASGVDLQFALKWPKLGGIGARQARGLRSGQPGESIF